MLPVHDQAHWETYNTRQGERPARPLLVDALALAGTGASRRAVDLGCGRGIETRALLAAGWRVHALDGHPLAPEWVRSTAGDLARNGLEVVVRDFRELATLPAADLVYAGYSLPYVPPTCFDRVWAAILSGLRPGGWLAAHLFGDRDSWAGNPDMTFLTSSQARDLLAGLDVARFVEQDEDGEAFSGPKHWHVFRVVARRPADVLGSHRPVREGQAGEAP